MFYFRPPSGDRALNRGTARIATTVALLAYPAGAFLLAFAEPTLASSITGYALIVLAYLGATSIVSTRWQRIIAEQPERLDEWELKLRAHATYWAFATFSTLVLAAIMYAAVAADAGWWKPESYEEWNGLFWGTFLYVTVLPSAFLAWQADDTGAEDEA